MTSPCPICGENYVQNSIRELSDGLSLEYNCERCGKYKISRQLIDDQPWLEVKHLVSAWVKRENRAGIPSPTIGAGADVKTLDSSEWADRFRRMGFPETTNEKLDALLRAYADSTESDYKRSLDQEQPQLISKVAAKDKGEIKGLTTLLRELDYIKQDKDSSPRTISAKGWLRIDELHKAIITSDSVFIAMWFSNETKKYREAVIAAINYCGYRPVIIDQEEYNDFIMDQIVSSIKQARFLIADFTCRPETTKGNEGKVKNGVRGGVYWEAGMAYGLGRPVIHTCEDNQEAKNRIHFDVNQYNTIFWKSNDLGANIRSLEESRSNPTFAERLAARIMATIGKGSYMPS
jgi:hypothetical protein